MTSFSPENAMKNLLAAALILVVGSIVLSQSPMSAQEEEKAIPPDHPMWEYEQVSLKDIPNKDEMLKVLNERGVSGWELVDVLPRGSFEKGARDQYPTLLFKKGLK
jgi:hypothetical protein